ncbi:MAG: diaminopimelate decarboxylase [Deltaproteobacteria bacterium]|nr:diaminopimelate decarboxylase [Deltaproteobacteria bacterium]
MSNDRELLLRLVHEYSSPLYVYDIGVVRAQVQRLLDSVGWKKKQILYAVKANYNPSILALIREMGLSIDTVSPAEVHLALASGFSPRHIMFTANNCSDADLQEVHALGVLCNLDSLSALRRFARMFPGSPVCLRINPEITAGSHKAVQTAGVHVKFGILPEDLGEVVSIAKSAGLSIVGLHEHTGSGMIDPEDYLKGAKKLAELLTPQNFPHLQFVDFGGGLGVPYQPDTPELPTAILGAKLSALFEDICKSFGRELELCMEPGKYLVAQCGTLLVQVTTLRNNRGKLIAGVNSGFSHLIRPVLYGAYHHIENLSNPSAATAIYDVVGNICESGDYFAEERALPEIREGDILAIRTAGAYGASMASLYNLRPLPGEVSVENGKVLRHIERRSNKDLSSHFR